MGLIDILFFFVLLPVCVVFVAHKIVRFRGGFRSQLSALRADEAGAAEGAEESASQED